MQTHNPAESFSFEEDSKKRHMNTRSIEDIRRMEDQFIIHDTLNLEDLDT
jgi:hypothetical protein